MNAAFSIVSEILEEALGLDGSENQADAQKYVYADAFRSSMRRLAAGTCAVTVNNDGEIFGLTATSVTSLSMDPPSLLVSIRSSSRILDVLRRKKQFTVHVLGEEQSHQANAFSGRFGSGSRADLVEWIEQEGLPPRLAGATCHIDCRVGRFMPVYSHIVVVGVVERVDVNDHSLPLLYFDGAFHALGSKI